MPVSIEQGTMPENLPQLSDFILNTCRLKSIVVEKLKACGIDMSTLLDSNLEELADFDLDLNKHVLQRICDCVQMQFNNTDSFEEKTSDESLNTDSNLTLNQRKRKRSASQITDQDKIKKRNFTEDELLNTSTKKVSDNGQSGNQRKKKKRSATQIIDDEVKTKKLKSKSTKAKLNNKNEKTNQAVESSSQNSASTSNLTSQNKKKSTTTKNCASNVTSSSSNVSIRIDFPKSKKLTYDIIYKEVLQSILEDSLEGLEILSEYKKNKILLDRSRKILVHTIVNRCNVNLGCSAVKFFEKVGNCIVQLFPEEDIDLYFIAPYSQGNETKNPKGLLCDKWRNVLYNLRKAGVVTKRSKEKGTSEIDKTQPGDCDEDTKGHMKWLKKNNSPWENVKIHWEATQKYRCDTNTFHGELYETIFEQDWPILKSDLGPQLLEIDFIYLHPDSALSIEKNWDKFFENLYIIRKNNITNLTGCKLKSLYDEYLKKDVEENVLDILRIMLLPYMIPANSRVSTQNSKARKPSKAESVEAFYIWCMTLTDVDGRLADRANRYIEAKERVQPCLVFVGKDLQSINQVYIKWGAKYSWIFNSVLQAVNALFQIFMLFNLQYPKDCENLWILLQHRLYNINTQYDKKIGAIISIENALQHLEQTEG